MYCILHFESLNKEKTRPKASGSSSRFQGGGVTGKGQDRDEIKTRQGQDRDKTGTRQGHDRGFRGLKKFSGGWWLRK